MTLESTSSTATSIDATQRKLIVGIVVATLMALAIVIADLAIGGRPDPPTLRAAATLLDGAWRFHIGDDPHWADANTDDNGLGNGRHDRPAGQPRRRRGSARLRRRVDGARSSRLSRLRLVPARGDGAGRTRLVGHPRADPRRGRLRTLLEWPTAGRVGQARPRPARRRHAAAAVRPSRRCGGHPWRARGPRIHASRSGASADGGGMHSPPILAPRPISDALHRVQWQRTIAGYIVDAIEPLAMLALIGLVLGYRSRSSHKGFLILASIALALMAARRLNNAIVAWTDLQDLTTYAWLAKVMWVPAVAAWTLAWNRWCLRPWRSIDVSAVSAGGRRDHRRRDPFGEW